MKLICGLLVCATFCGSAIGANVYSVGNSLTWDAMSYRNIAAAAGAPYAAGYHIRGGQSLPSIASLPDNSDLLDPVFGPLGTALSGYTWDAVTFQPFYGSTLAQDQAVISSFISITTARPANAATQFYVYAAYPGRPDTGTYADEWLLPSNGQDDQSTVLSRAYFNDLMPRVRASQPAGQKPALMIPMGEVMFELEKAIQRDDIPGLNSATDLYRDPVHLNDAGWLAVASTFYATIYRTDPRSIPLDLSQFPNWGDGYVDLTPAMASAIQDVVWNVVSTNEYSGVPEPAALSLLILSPLLLRRTTRRQVTRRA